MCLAAYRNSPDPYYLCHSCFAPSCACFTNCRMKICREMGCKTRIIFTVPIESVTLFTVIWLMSHEKLSSNPRIYKLYVSLENIILDIPIYHYHLKFSQQCETSAYVDFTHFKTIPERIFVSGSFINCRFNIMYSIVT